MPYKFVDDNISKNVSSSPIKGSFKFVEPTNIPAEPPPKRSFLEKSARIGGQLALGSLENALLPYEASAASLSSKEAQQVPYRHELFKELNSLKEKKNSGEWNENDQEMYDHLLNQIKNPKEAEKYIKTADIGVRGLAEKATGLDLHPEGVLEKAANWTGFLKKPSSIKELVKIGLKPKDLVKAIIPGEKALRGLGAGAALQIAEEGNFGPIGTMAVAALGDIVGNKIKSPLSFLGKLATSPKQTLAETAAKFTPKQKLELQKQIIQDFRDSGIQADIGTLTNSNLLKWTQSRLAQSGLTGDALDKFRKQLTDQIKTQYNNLAETIGEARFQSSHEAGEVIKEGIKKIREKDLSSIRDLYKTSSGSLKEFESVDPSAIANQIDAIEKELRPGKIKSTEQSSVLEILDKLKKDLYDESGEIKLSPVKDLVNDKIALNDIINYEVQGGTKQHLKRIVKELDKAILSHGKQNPSFAKNYYIANKKFSEHAKKFRNRSMTSFLKSSDPSKVINKMNSVQGIREIGDILNSSKEGKEIFNNLKRLKLDQTIGDKLVDSTTQQIKLGTFSKLLEKGNSREVMKELLGNDSFRVLEKIQNNAGHLADAAQKFYNASKSASVGVDVAIMVKFMQYLGLLFSGVPWPLLQTGAGILAMRKFNNLLADPKFLITVEDVILQSKKKDKKSLIQAVEKLSPYLNQLTKKETEKSQD